MTIEEIRAAFLTVDEIIRIGEKLKTKSNNLSYLFQCMALGDEFSRCVMEKIWGRVVIKMIENGAPIPPDLEELVMEAAARKKIMLKFLEDS